MAVDTNTDRRTHSPAAYVDRRLVGAGAALMTGGLLACLAGAALGMVAVATAWPPLCRRPRRAAPRDGSPPYAAGQVSDHGRRRSVAGLRTPDALRRRALRHPHRSSLVWRSGAGFGHVLGRRVIAWLPVGNAAREEQRDEREQGQHREAPER